ncbi:MAG: hypothetical protein M0Q44_02720 [Methylobacter sp.]|jgi:hypothetical protein|nr:hypothetical protein [Methylobacter sp.]
MRNISSGFLLVARLVLAFGPSSAWALGGAESLKIDHFCNVKSPRQTLIYIDDKVLVKGDTQWALQLINKTMANLMPSEPVTLVKLATETGAAQERWKACYPDIPVTEMEKRKQSAGILEKFTTADPSKQLKEQQAVFKAQMTGALEKLLLENSHETAADSLAKKQVVRAFENDLARFDARNGAIRVIVYSDMLENSDLINGLSAKPNEAKALADARKLNFQNAVFHVFGAGKSGNNADGLKAFWEALIEGGSGTLADMGSELVLNAKAPDVFKIYDVEIELTKDDVRRGKLRLFVDSDGKLQESVLTIGTKQRSLLDDGEFLCQQENCTLQAKARRPVVVAEGKEEFKLTGLHDKLTGKLQIPGTQLSDGKEAVFNMTIKLSK